jgi:hypothetical protein
VEAAEVKNAVCDAYVKYGVNVFEHDHTENLRMREEEGVSSGGTVHGDYRFSDDEAEEPVGLNEAPAPQYDLMTDLLHVDMFKVLSDMLCSEVLLIKRGNSEMFEYLPMMAVATLGALNTESFCERVLSCVKLVVSDFTYV